MCPSEVTYLPVDCLCNQLAVQKPTSVLVTYIEHSFDISYDTDQ